MIISSLYFRGALCINRTSSQAVCSVKTVSFRIPPLVTMPLNQKSLLSNKFIVISKQFHVDRGMFAPAGKCLCFMKEPLLTLTLSQCIISYISHMKALLINIQTRVATRKFWPFIPISFVPKVWIWVILKFLMLNVKSEIQRIFFKGLPH